MEQICIFHDTIACHENLTIKIWTCVMTWLLNHWRINQWVMSATNNLVRDWVASYKNSEQINEIECDPQLFSPL